MEPSQQVPNRVTEDPSPHHDPVNVQGNQAGEETEKREEAERQR